MKLSVLFRRVAALAAFAVTAVVVPVVSTSSPAAAACTWCAGGEYHPLTPERIFDSRPADANNPNRPINDVAPFGAKPLTTADPSFNIQLLGEGGVPAVASDVLAVVVSITIIGPSQAGNLAAYPAGSSSSSSLLNFRAGQTVPNLAIVRAGTNGQLTIRMHGVANGSAHVLVDVFGWFSTSAYDADTPGDETDERGARLISVNPGRLLDTRPNPLGPGQQRTLQIRGADTVAAPIVNDIVPNSANVVGVLLNVTAARPSANTFVSVLPDTPVGQPTTSNLNLVPLQTKANLVMVPVGADGAIHLYNNAGNTNLVVDVMGYLLAGTSEATRAGRVIPLTAPFRVFDTRQASFGAAPLGPGQAEDWSFASFANSVSVGAEQVGNQSALIGNLTNASLVRQYPTVGVEPSYLTVYPADSPSLPVVSNLNSVETGAVPNMALVKYGANQTVRVFNAKGYAHYILDVSAVVLAD